jgi:hypothetical protein
MRIFWRRLLSAAVLAGLLTTLPLAHSQQQGGRPHKGKKGGRRGGAKKGGGKKAPTKKGGGS